VLAAVLTVTTFSIGAVLLLRWLDPPTSAFMLYAAWRGDKIDYQWTDWQDLSKHLAIAVLAAEDQRFPDHFGFDLTEIKNAVSDSIKGDQLRGASTITQQVAKNLFLWRTRSLLRKALEAWFTFWIEVLWSKQRTLEMYLNIAQFGPEVYGAGAASRHYFGRPARRIQPAQAALMAAVLPNPYLLSLGNPSDYIRARAGQIQEQVRSLGGPAYLLRIHK